MKKHESPRQTTEQDPPVAWDVLLAKWVEFAKAASINAAAGDPAARATADAIPHIITLQGHIFALAEAHRLTAPERRIAAARARHAISKAASSLRTIHHTSPMPDGLLDLLTDARHAIDATDALTLHLRVAQDDFHAPDPWPIAQDLKARGFSGKILAAPTGLRLLNGAPCITLCPDPHPIQPPTIPGLVPDRTVAPPEQIYRLTQTQNAPAHDLIAPMLTELPAGTPLLRTILDDGNLTPKPNPQAIAAEIENLNQPLEASPHFTIVRPEHHDPNNTADTADDLR